MDKTKKVSSANKLALITEQRSALEKVVKISLAITRLQSGLESLLSVGKDESELSEEQINEFEIVSKNIQHLPTDKLKTSITFLDSYINTALFDVIALVSQGERSLQSSDNVDAIEIENIHNDLHTRLQIFKQKSQTAVVVRLLLRKRGFATAPFKLPIPETVITDKISELEDKEKSCRKRIGKEIDTIEVYIDNLLTTENLPESILEEMTEVKASLQTNRQHLLEGKSIEDLPIVFEIVEMGSEETNYYLGNKPFDDEKTTEDDVPVEPPQTKVEQGFFRRIKTWLNTPLNVGWKDIDKYK